MKPPCPIEELRRFVLHVASAVEPMAWAVARHAPEFELLRECRIRLVADPETGKHDVREAAAQLQNERSSEAAGDDPGSDLDADSLDKDAGP